jgi:hypothetical protein
MNDILEYQMYTYCFVVFTNPNRAEAFVELNLNKYRAVYFPGNNEFYVEPTNYRRNSRISRIYCLVQYSRP